MFRDWAFYSDTFTNGQSHTFSKGIVRSVYLAPVAAIAITHVVPLIFYMGAYPTAPLVPATTGAFQVRVRVLLRAPPSTKGARFQVTIVSDWSTTPITQLVSAPADGGDFETSILLPNATSVELWWPRGLGSQRMYTFNVSVAAASHNITAGAAAHASRRIGFRVAHLITADESMLGTSEADHEGSGNFTMRFRINGASPVLRGANIMCVVLNV